VEDLAGVELEEYRIMYEAEDTHWWYRGLRGVMFALLGLDRAGSRQPQILDAGCGTGGNMQALLNAGQTRLEGFDFSADALHFCRQRNLPNVKEGSIADIPFESDRFDIVISCDVINDAGLEDDAAGIRELYRVLKPGGRLFLNLPAFDFLRGEHDQATSVARRYTRKLITRKLNSAGFVVRRASYWNMFLFPVVLAVRLMRPGNKSDPKKPVRSDINLPHPLINTVLTRILSAEKILVRRFDLPFGSSLAVVAVKPRAARRANG
jgi:SAM-dependent methyltransferase